MYEAPKRLPVFVESYFVDELDLDPNFFLQNIEKAKVWVPEVQKMALEVKRGKCYPYTAPTGGGKTVMGLAVATDLMARVLFLVPTRRMANPHQQLYRDMGGNLRTKVITGETSSNKREWTNKSDRVIFATGHVVISNREELEKIISSFDLIIFDEYQNTRTKSHPYAIIAKIAQQLKIPRIGLSATPGNSDKKKFEAITNCCLFVPKDINIPVSKKIGSLVHMENASIAVMAKHRFIVDFIKVELGRIAMKFNWLANQVFKLNSRLDHEKTLSIKQVVAYRKWINELFPATKAGQNYHLFEDKKKAGILSSILWEYQAWIHVMHLVNTECYESVAAYYDNTLLSKNSAYVRRIVKRGAMLRLINLTKNTVHPKLELLFDVLQSLDNLGLQALTFINNSVFAQAIHTFLVERGLTNAMVFGGRKMSVAKQEAVAQLLTDRKIQSLTTTSVSREGVNMKVDVVVVMSPHFSMIRFLQESGRAGRGDIPALVIYIANEYERRAVLLSDRQASKQNPNHISQFKGRILDEPDSIESLPDDIFTEDFTEQVEVLPKKGVSTKFVLKYLRTHPCAFFFID